MIRKSMYLVCWTFSNISLKDISAQQISFRPTHITVVILRLIKSAAKTIVTV